MAEQLQRGGMPDPKAIGIEEISIRKGHTYRIVVSDRLRKTADSGSAVPIQKRA